jgi:hypothetical protein
MNIVVVMSLVSTASEGTPQPVIPCTGDSSNLAATDCAVWRKFYDALSGIEWSYCSDLRDDPCACSYSEIISGVKYDLGNICEDGRYLLWLRMRNNKMEGRARPQKNREMCPEPSTRRKLALKTPTQICEVQTTSAPQNCLPDIWGTRILHSSVVRPLGRMINT